MRSLFTFVAFLLLATGLFASDPVDSSRLIYGGTWQGKVGVSNGIPARTTISTTLATSSTAAQINSAITACASNSVVKLDAGTFSLNAAITIAKDGVTLRGSTNSGGQPTTILDFSVASGGIIMGSASGWDTSDSTKWTTVDISSGVSRGSDSIVVAATPTGLTAGMIAWLSAPLAGNVTGGGFSDFFTAPSGASRPATQGVKITSVSGTTVTFWPPISADYWTGTIRLHWRGAGDTIHFPGLEDVSLVRSGGSAESTTTWVEWYGVDEGWTKNVKAYWVGDGVNHMRFYACFAPEVRHCEMTKMTYSANGSTKYCILSQQTSSFLVVDNIFTNVPNVMPIYGGTGGAFCYNFIANMPYSTGSPELLSQIVYFHGSHTAYCLFEGNWCPSHYHDNTPGSRNNIFFRERIRGWDEIGPTGAGKTAGVRCHVTESHHDNIVIAGCVMGEDGNSQMTIYSDANNGDIYQLDTTSASTLNKYANYNTVDDGINASETLTGGQALVNSYLFSSQPATITHFWPVMASGDFTQFSGLKDSTNMLAAAYRIQYNQDPPWAAAGGGDSTPPVVTITSPTSSPTYSTGGSTIDLSGTSSDDVSVSSVTWSNDRGGSGTATGTTSWSQTGITLLTGVNVITVTATDSSSNTSTDTITVTYSTSTVGTIPTKQIGRRPVPRVFR